MKIDRDDLVEGWRLHNASQTFRNLPSSLAAVPGISATQPFNLLRDIYEGTPDHRVSCITTQSEYWYALQEHSSIPLKGGMKLIECLHPVLARVFLNQRDYREAHHLYTQITRALVELHLTDLSERYRKARFAQFRKAVNEGIKLCSIQLKKFLTPHGIPAEVIELLGRNFEAALLLETWATANGLFTKQVVGVRFFRLQGLHPLWIDENQEVSCLVIPIKP